VLLRLLINFVFSGTRGTKHLGAIIQSNLNEEQSINHAALLSKLSLKASNLVQTLDVNDELTFLRIRSRKKEIMISPDKDYLLVVIQDPNAVE